MKRAGVGRIGADDPGMGPQQPVSQMQASTSMHTLQQASQPIMATGAHMSVVSGGATMLSLGGNFVRGVGTVRSASPQVLNYLKPNVQGVPYANKQPQPLPKHKPLGGQSPGGAGSAGAAPGVPPAPTGQFQRLKVEDALSYLDQVKYKFSAHPQVYNDFLDIMKEFKSQSIDTPGVIARVSNLFKGHPELIVGFNTFLPPGYKIEVQSNGQGVAYQVSVSMPSPTGIAGAPVSGVLLPAAHHPPAHQQLVHLLPTQPMQTGIVHNLSVPSAASNTLHHISQAHQQIEAAAAAAAQHHASAGGVASVAGAGHVAVANTGQPVEFNHAIEYVNKIKSRFSRQPDKYKRFLEILHAYQRGHRAGEHVKEAKQQTEQEVYAQVAKLFENQDDLLAEFGQFLPDAGGGKASGTPPPAAVKHYPPPPQQAMQIQPQQRASVESDSYAPPPQPAPHSSPPLHHVQHPPHPQLTSKHSSSLPPQSSQQSHSHLKRSPSFTSSSQIGLGAPPAKKSRCALMSGAGVRDVSYAEAAKYGTLADYSFFDRVRKALRSQEIYDNFLRCLLLFTNEVISATELLTVTSPFLSRHAELFKWFQDLVGPPPAEQNSAPEKNDSIAGYNSTHVASEIHPPERDRPERPAVRYESIGTLGAQFRHDRAQGDAAMDIDLTTCKRLGTSYCALPRGSADTASRRCSGRTPLCREVLNDTWVSFPTWSEDSTFVTSRKTQFEEYIYRCEDERFELDVVIETNAATIRVLEAVQKKMSRMSPDELSKFRLDDCLGGTSPTIHQRALRRIYGEKAGDIIAGLKKNPQVAIPVVLRRLKAKEEDWREAQKGFNKQWRELNEKYYLKSLDHQGINFKQMDLKALRSKSLFSDMESAYAAGRPGPHLTVNYGIRTRQEGIKILRDAAELLIHHARRQTAIQKAEKSRIKQLLRQFIPDLFDHPQQPPSDDERDDEEKEEGSGEGGSSPAQDENTSGPANRPDTTPPVKMEKQEPSSESDTNTSDRGGSRTRKDPKTNHSGSTENGAPNKESNGKEVKRSDSSNGEEVKSEPMDEDDLKDAPPNEARFVCTSSWYLFLRLHGVLCARLAAARRAAAAIAEQEALDHKSRAPSVALALRLKPTNTVPPSEYYNALLELVRSVLDGNMESASYEDAVREMLGIKAYPTYTLDKVVSYAVRQLQHCVSEAWSVHACNMAARGGMRAGGAAYVRRARRYLRHEHAATLARVYGGDECRVTYELLNSGEDRTQPEGAAARRLAAWSLYSERYARPDTDDTPNKPVFLRRNVRRCGGGDGPARAATHADCAPAPHARRKPPKILDTSEATLAGRLRLVASRPHQLYRRGCLRGARDSHARLHESRRSRFRTWHDLKIPADSKQ